MADLLTDVPMLPERAFDGATYKAAKDYARLTGQLRRVEEFMSDGRWHRLREIADACHGSEAGVSARLRDLRKPKYGLRNVERDPIGDGLYQYRLVA